MVDFPEGGLLTDTQLRYMGGALAYFVAGIHLLHPQRGLPRLVLIIGTGNASLLISDPRPLAFVLSGFAIIVGVGIAAIGRRRKLIYLLGILLMVAYLVGYFAWHLTGHGGFLPVREPIYHGMHPVEAVVSHLVEYPLARVSKIAEAALLIVLVILYRREILVRT